MSISAKIETLAVLFGWEGNRGHSQASRAVCHIQRSGSAASLHHAAATV